MSARLNPGIFRQYDIRGHAENDLTSDNVCALGRAFGTAIHRSGGRRVTLGRDCRLSGPRVMEAFERGVLSSGVDVINLGVVPTPVLYFSLHRLEVDGGVIITGSHNPPAWNGFKLCNGTHSMHGDQIQELLRLIQSEDFESGQGERLMHDICPDYISWQAENIQTGVRPISVVIDAGNGTAGIVAGDIYRAIGAEVVELFCEPDGHFPNHHPDPTIEDNIADLRRAVAESKADIGIAYDGDADRIGAIDGRGRIVWGDQLLTIFGRDLLERAPESIILGEVKCSKVMYDELRGAGGQVEMWKVGHSLIKARMREVGASLAGEMSGHIFFADRYFGFDDAIYAGSRLIELLSRSDDSLSAMIDALPQMSSTPEIRVACEDSAKFDVTQRAAEHFSTVFPVVTVDGVRVEFEHGWGLIRASNTQPVLVLRFEATTAAFRDEYRALVEGWLAANAPEVDFDADTHH